MREQKYFYLFTGGSSFRYFVMKHENLFPVFFSSQLKQF
jgi:hypothetical protein